MYEDKNAIALCRVSNPQQAQERDSLEEQERGSIRFAETRGLNLVRVFKEPFSGRKDIRPVLEEMIRFIKKHPEPIHFCIVRGIDRFTRAGSKEYQILKERLEAIGAEIVDIYGVIQPKQNTLEHLGIQYDWSVYAPSEAAEIMEAHRGKQEVRDILTRLIGTEIRLTQEGFQTRQPLDGYLNQKIEVDGKKKVIEAPDPERARFYQEMFKLRAEGTLSDKEIVERLNAMGFRTRKKKRWSATRDRVIAHIGGEPLTVKQFQKILLRTRYCGVRCEKWTHYQPVKAQYKGLVSIDLFNRANRGKIHIQKHKDGTLRLFRDYGIWGKVKRLRNNPTFPFKFILCPHCRKPFLGSSPKGRSGARYPTYHCHRGHKYYGISKTEFEGKIKDFIDKIIFTPEFLNVLEALLMDKYRINQRDVTQNSSEVNRQVAELKHQQAGVLDSLVVTQSAMVRQQLERKVEELESQIQQTEDTRTRIDVKERDIKRLIQYARYLMEHPSELLVNNDDLPLQRAIFGLVFEETPTYDEIVNGTAKMSIIFKLSKAFNNSKPLLVNYQGFSWNHFDGVVRQWCEVFDLIK